MKLAQDAINNPLLGDLDLSGTEFFSNMVSSLVTLFFIAGVVIFVLILLISAINWITSGGDKAKATVAREKMFNAFIGIFILFIIFAIVQIVGALFDIDLLRMDLSVLQLGYSGDGSSCDPPPPGACGQIWFCVEDPPGSCNWDCECISA